MNNPLSYRLAHRLAHRLASLLAALTFGLTYSAAQAEHSLNLALVTSLSGAAAIHGQSIRKGVELGLGELRAEGWKTTLAVEDDQTTPSITVSAVNKLAAQGHTLFIGPTWSYLAESVAPVYERLGVIAIGPAVSSDVVGASSSRFFFGTRTAEGKVAPLAEWMKREGVKRAALVIANSRWGTVHEDIFRRAAALAGAEVIAAETFEYGQENSALKPLLVRLNRLKPDAYLTTSSKEGAVEMNRALLDLKAHTSLLSTEDIQDAARMGILPKATQGVSRWAVTHQSSPEFIERYRAHFKETPYLYADSAYDAVKLYAMAVAKTDGSPAAVEAFFRSVDFEGASGRWRFDKKGDVLKNDYEVVSISGELGNS